MRFLCSKYLSLQNTATNLILMTSYNINNPSLEHIFKQHKNKFQMAEALLFPNFRNIRKSNRIQGINTVALIPVSFVWIWLGIQPPRVRSSSMEMEGKLCIPGHLH